MLRRIEPRNLMSVLRHIAVHVLITGIAVGIALSLPVIAEFILFDWWPTVSSDPGALFIAEVGFAAALVVIMNIVLHVHDGRENIRSAKLASLVYARGNENWFARWRERRLVKKLPASRDVYVMTRTGYDTFVSNESLLSNVLEAAYEIRVMLLNPYSVGARQHIASFSDEKYDATVLCHEIESSISILNTLRASGKKVTLKFYDQQPFWKIAVLSNHVWVQYCHGESEIKKLPEYVFAMNARNPKRGLYIPFYMHFLETWAEPTHPEYDFDTRQLIYYAPSGKEIRRVSFHCDVLSFRKTRVPEYSG